MTHKTIATYKNLSAERQELCSCCPFRTVCRAVDPDLTPLLTSAACIVANASFSSCSCVQKDGTISTRLNTSAQAANLFFLRQTLETLLRLAVLHNEHNNNPDFARAVIDWVCNYYGTTPETLCGVPVTYHAYNGVPVTPSDY